MLKTLSVTELSSYITNIFEAEELLHNIKVYGEISNLSCVRGNLYFNLKDENSLIPCIMFGSGVNSIKEGDQILASGTVRYYGKGGKINLYINSFIPYGSGVLYQKFIELKNKLEKEGIFSDKYKKPLPYQINKIGVITSITGAVVHDIEVVSHRRNPSLNIVVYPAKVQGEGAENTIIKGIERLNKIDDIDVIIIARGGGSIEDLEPFNKEILARAIIKSVKPIISAVGHETDFTICDFASSLRAATPSVAGELVSVNQNEILSKIKQNLEKITYLIYNLIDGCFERINPLIEKIDFSFENLFIKKESLFNKNILKLQEKPSLFFNKKEHNLEVFENKLNLLNPKNILKNGWAKIEKNNKVITNIDEINYSDEIKIELIDGSVIALVKDKQKNNG